MTAVLSARYGSIAVLAWLLAGTTARGAAAGWPPVERADTPDRVVSFLQDAGLSGRNLFTLAFRPTPDGLGVESVWIATADGLRAYDGYSWRRYGTAEGLPSEFVRCVTVTRSGEVWVGTDRGAGVLGREGFQTRGSELGLAGPNVRRIHEDRDGTLWFCSDSWPDASAWGGLTSFRDGRWKAYRRPEGLPSEYVVNFHQGLDGRRWAATLGGLARFEGERWVPVAGTEAHGAGGRPWSSAAFVETPETGLLCNSGLGLFAPASARWLPIAPARTEYGICATADGAVLAGIRTAPGIRAFAQLGTHGWEKVSADFEVHQDYLEDLREAPDGSVWAVAHNTLVRWTRRSSGWKEWGGVPPPQFVDGQGRAWFHSDTAREEALETAARYTGDGRWEVPEVVAESIHRDGRGDVWGLETNRITQWTAGGFVEHGAAALGLARVRSGRADPQAGFWALGWDSGGRGRVARHGGGGWAGRPLPEFDASPEILGIAAGDDLLWALLHEPGRSNAMLARITLRDTALVPMPIQRVPIFWRSMHADRAGRLWLWGDSGLLRRDPGEGADWLVVTNLPGRAVRSFVERGDEIWLSHSGITGGNDGLARWRGGNWAFFDVAVESSLSLGPDRMLVFAGSRFLGLVADAPDAEPVTLPIPTRERITRAVADGQGSYWLGTGSTVFRLRPDRTPPETRLTARVTNVLAGDDLVVGLVPVGKFQLMGGLERCGFSHRLDGGAWSGFLGGGSLRIQTGGLRPGMHRLEVRARDPEWDVDPTPEAIAFSVYPVPLQSRGWFGPVVGLVVVALAGLSAAALTARAKLAGHARDLEDRVAERTSQLEADIEARERTQASLQESERQNRLLVQMSPDGIFVNSRDRIVFVNDTGLRLLRAVDPSQVLGRSPFDFLHVDDHPVIRERIAQLLQGPASVPLIEERLVALDGTLIPVEVGASSAWQDGELVIQVVYRDITERRRAEEAIRQRLRVEERLSRLAATAPGAMFAFRLGSDGRSSFAYVSPKVEELLGVPVDALSENLEATLPRVHPADPDRVLAPGDGSGYAAFARWEHRFRFQHPAKGEIWIEGYSAPADREADGSLLWHGFLLDVTAREQAEAGFERQRIQLAGIVESAMDAIVTFDEAGRVVVFNPAAERLLRCSAAEALGTEVHRFVPGRHREAHGCRLRQFAASGSASRRITASSEAVGLRADGEEFPLEASLSQVVVAGRRLFTLICRDVTDVRRAEADRRSLEAQLQHAEKMKAIGTLAGGIAHDFNNLLAAILSNLELARLDLPEAHPAVAGLRGIQTAAARARTLVRQILAFSRPTQPERRVILLREVIDETLGLLRSTLPAGVRLATRVSPATPPVLADPAQMQQALMNLCTNAWHALDGRYGVIEIALDSLDVAAGTPPAGKGVGLAPGKWIRLSVLDDGHGMDAAILERIFEPFFTTRGPHEGTGLGLSIVHGIVQAHGGTIRVDSRRGAGTRFDLYLPASEGSPGVESRAHPAPIRGQGQRILFIDDEASILNSVSRLLQRLGFRVSAFPNPAEALAAFHAEPGAFDLVITDLNMPGGSGLEVADAVRRCRDDLPVILSSGYITDELLAEALRLGIHRVLSKPHTVTDLTVAIHAALGGSGAASSVPA